MGFKCLSLILTTCLVGAFCQWPTAPAVWPTFPVPPTAGQPSGPVKEGSWTRPVLVDDLTGERYIQDGNWLYRVLTDSVRTGWDGRKYVVDGNVLKTTTADHVFNDGIRENCAECLIFRDMGIDGTTDWVLDGRKVFFDKDFAKILRPVGYTSGVFVDGSGSSADSVSPLHTTLPAAWNDPNSLLLNKDALKLMKKYAELSYMNSLTGDGVTKPVSPKDSLKKLKKYKEYTDTLAALGLTPSDVAAPKKPAYPANTLPAHASLNPEVEQQPTDDKKVVKHSIPVNPAIPVFPDMIPPIAKDAIERANTLKKFILDWKKYYLTMDGLWDPSWDPKATA